MLSEARSAGAASQPIRTDGGAARPGPADAAAEPFQGLILRHRGRTGLTQRELAARVGVSRGAVQDWESGLNYPDAQHLQALIAVFLQAGGLAAGREEDEAEMLWAAALRESPRMQTPFDSAWWAGLMARRPGFAAHGGEMPGARRSGTQAPPRPGHERLQDWGEAPDVSEFQGREDELETLHQWMVEDHCRLLAVLGMGGIGKTMTAARLAQDVARAFERVYWRSMRNAPLVDEWLAGAIGFLSDQQVIPPVGEAARLTRLIQLLRERRCLLVMDNMETLLESGRSEGIFRDGYAGYARVLQAIGQSSHQSCLISTSRELSAQFAVLSGSPGVRTLELRGLNIDGLAGTVWRSGSPARTSARSSVVTLVRFSNRPARVLSLAASGGCSTSKSSAARPSSRTC